MLARMRSLVSLVALAAALHASAAMPSAQLQPAQQPASVWAQWGGPNRNFVSDARGLASSWSAAGPTRLWSRALGEGHSAIVSDGARLYTMYRPLGLLAAVRRSQEEVIVAIDPASGATQWEYRFPSPTSGVDFSEGAGPHSTPLVAGDRVFAVGSRKELFALDKTNGHVLWMHDMIKEFGAGASGRGYSCSPLLYGETIILTMGGAGQALAAFNQRTGGLIWKAGNFDTSPASPI